VLEGAPNAYNAIQRKLGFDEALNAAGIKVVASQTAYWETDKANQVASAIINEHPEIKAMICANDSMALGAVAALRAAGKLDSVIVSGFDNIKAVQELLKAKDVIVTADQHADEVGGVWD
jgi:ribose transport system substrate-binding protein